MAVQRPPVCLHLTDSFFFPPVAIGASSCPPPPPPPLPPIKVQHFRGDCLHASWRLHAQVSGELSRILHSSSFTLSDSRLASSEEAFGSGGPLEDAAMWIRTGRGEGGGGGGGGGGL